MKTSGRSIVPLFALALFASAPMVLAQDASTPPPPASSGGDDQAPPPPPHRHMRGPTAEQLKAKLNLTADQFTQVSAIMSKQRENAMALRDDDSLSDDDKRAKMMALMKSGHDQIRALLTADQQKIFDAMKPPQHGNGGPPPPPPAPPADAPAPPAATQ